MGVRGWTKAQKSSACWQAQGCHWAAGLGGLEAGGKAGKETCIIKTRHQQGPSKSSGCVFHNFQDWCCSEGPLQSLWPNTATIHPIHPQPTSPSGVPSSCNMQRWHRELHPDPDLTFSSIYYCSQNCLHPSQWDRQCLPSLLGFLESCEEQPAPDPAVPGGLLNAQQILAGKEALTQGVPPFFLGALGSYPLFPPWDTKCPLPKDSSSLSSPLWLLPPE